jgi:hypothetical protein
MSIDASNNHPLEAKTNFVQFRVSEQDYEEMSRIASLVFQKKLIKTNSVSSLAKACTFTQLNQFRAIENQQRMIEEYDRLKQLERDNYTYTSPNHHPFISVFPDFDDRRL